MFEYIKIKKKKPHYESGAFWCSCGNFASLTRSRYARRDAMLRIPRLGDGIEFLTKSNKKDRHKDGLIIGAPAGTRIPDTLIKSPSKNQKYDGRCSK